MFKNDVFQLVNERSCGDPTCWSFDVEFDESTTVYDFLKEVSTKLRRNSIQVEHGTVTIYDKLHPSKMLKTLYLSVTDQTEAWT